MIRNTAHRWLTVPVALAVGLLSACTTTQSGTAAVGDNGTADSTAQADKAGVQAQEQGPNAANFRGHFGPEAMLRNALSEANLSADQQKTVDAALANAFPGKEGAEEGVMKPFFAMLADEVRSGKIDEAALNAKATELSAGAGDHHAQMAQAIQTVHDTLTADQRATVAASIQDKMSKFEAFEGKGEGGRHHEKGEKGEKGEHHGMGRLGFLLHGVDLQDGQLDKIKTALEAAGIGKEHEAMEGKRAEMKQHMQAMLEAFKADQFDAKTALPERREMMGEHLTHLVKAMGVIVPLLDDTQRAALAKNVENGPQHPMWRGHGGAAAPREQAPAETNE